MASLSKIFLLPFTVRVEEKDEREGQKTRILFSKTYCESGEVESSKISSWRDAVHRCGFCNRELHLNCTLVALQ
jgi:hypothetical protein